MADVHSDSEIYLPGSAGDDCEQFPTFPVSDGTLTEPKASGSAWSHVDMVDDAPAILGGLQDDDAETLLSSERKQSPEDFDHAPNAGGVGGSDGSETAVVQPQASDEFDAWS